MKFYPRVTIAGHFTGMLPVDESMRPEPESWVRWATHKATMDELQQCRVALKTVAEIIESDDPDYDEVMEIIERAVRPEVL